MSNAEGRRPNFFIVGAGKAGTTSLHEYLSQHPDIFMSPLKETHYFSPEFRQERLTAEWRTKGKGNEEELRAYLDAPGPLAPKFAAYVSSLKDYLRIFADAKDERVVGEACPSYLWSPGAAAAIAEFAPEAKILMILRNPVDRAYSQYVQMANSGMYDVSFQEHLEACVAHRDNGEISNLYPFLQMGLYAGELERYREAFPEEQIGVWLYEDTLERGFHRKVFEFLGVDSEFAADTSRRHLEQRIPRIRLLRRLIQTVKRQGITLPQALRGPVRKVFYRSRRKMRMSEAERALLVGYYCEDVKRLEGMLGRDLSQWLR